MSGGVKWKKSNDKQNTGAAVNSIQKDPKCRADLIKLFY